MHDSDITDLEPWVLSFRFGWAPHLPTAGLVALRDALATGDPRVINKATARGVQNPETYEKFGLERVTCACPAGYACWQGQEWDHPPCVMDVERAFVKAIGQADADLQRQGLIDREGYPITSRHFTEWVDSRPMANVRPLLLLEVDRELTRRQENDNGAVQAT